MKFFGKILFVLFISMQLWMPTVVGSPRLQGASTPSSVTFHPSQPAGISPVQILEVRVNGINLKSDASLPTDLQWLKTTEIIVKNVSKKPIVESGLTLLFYDSSSPNGNLMASESSFLGKYPARALVRPDGSSVPMPPAMVEAAPIYVAPGDTMTFSFARAGDDARSDLGENIGKVESIALQFNALYFVDDSRWYKGSFATPALGKVGWTPANPGLFLETER